MRRGFADSLHRFHNPGAADVGTGNKHQPQMFLSTLSVSVFTFSCIPLSRG
jgi:hypothetical protein